MSDSYHDDLDQTLEQYHQYRDSVVELQRNLQAISCSVTAPRRVVTVTVGPDGGVVDLKFPTNAYKRMTPAELAKVVVTTMSDARDKARSEVAKLLAPVMPPGMAVDDVLDGKADLLAMLPEEPRTAANASTGGLGVAAQVSR